uniref:Peptidase S1 domain-containing protein n=1 Tax=Panagrolaimus superbus TaxID=310955 RepID=A0A914Z8E4_9BILA
MNAETLIVFFVATIFLQQNVYGFNENRMRGGSESPAEMFEFLPALSFIVQGPAIDKIGSAVCSSTVISSRHILTAAHCVTITYPSSSMGEWVQHLPAILIDFRPKEKIVKVGKTNILEKVHLFLKNYSIQPRIYSHPSWYTVKTLANDIAIIEFPEGTDLKIKPVTLVSDYVEEDGDSAIAAGYGTHKYEWNPETKDFDGLRPSELLNATIPIHAGKKCPIPVSLQNVICVGVAGLLSDHGDSGGPLMFEKDGEYYQIGATSAGNNETVFYTRISKYCEWISKVTKGDAKCKPLPNDVNRKRPLSEPDPDFLEPAVVGATNVPLDEENGVTSEPKISQNEALKSDSNFAILNIVFLFFAAIFFFV